MSVHGGRYEPTDAAFKRLDYRPASPTSSRELLSLPAPQYRAERRGEHNEVLEVRIGGDVFRLNLAATIEQLFAATPPRRPVPAVVIPFHSEQILVVYCGYRVATIEV